MPTLPPRNAPAPADRATQLELFALFAFAFVLPLFEAPKNFFWMAYAVMWAANRWRARSWGGPPDAWDWLILAWVASGYLSAAFAGLHHGEWGSAFDILRYASVLWFVKRSGYDEATLRRLLGCIVVGTLAALAWGYYGVFVTEKRKFVGLNSVGHVNHSAIYLAIVFGLALAAMRASWASNPPVVRIGWLLLCALFTFSLFLMESRAAIGATFAATVIFLISYSLRLRLDIRKAVIGSIVVIAAVLLARPAVVKKNETAMQNNYFLQARDGVWRAGLDAWREFPFFGVGMGNYSRITFERLEDWHRARGEPFDRSTVFLTAHGHSLYVNTLAERGGIGLAVLLAVLLAWAASLARNAPRATSPPIAWAYWGAASFAWLISTIVGLVNTTLHHEHALVSMLLLGGWLSVSGSLSRTERR